MTSQLRLNPHISLFQMHLKELNIHSLMERYNNLLFLFKNVRCNPLKEPQNDISIFLRTKAVRDFNKMFIKDI